MNQHQIWRCAQCHRVTVSIIGATQFGEHKFCWRCVEKEAARTLIRITRIEENWTPTMRDARDIARRGISKYGAKGLLDAYWEYEKKVQAQKREQSRIAARNKNRDRRQKNRLLAKSMKLLLEEQGLSVDDFIRSA
jgi:hypothetical protein